MYQRGLLIFNSRYCTENISTFPEYHLKLIAQKVTCYDTNNFLRNLDALPSLPEDNILCTTYVLGLYPNIPHEDGLVAPRKTIGAREYKIFLTDSLIELVEWDLKNNIFEQTPLSTNN